MDYQSIIYNAAISDGMPDTLARAIVSQSKVETGTYSSDFFKKGNNCFGYSYDKNSKWQIKPGSKADNNIPIAQYSSINNSVHELTDWIRRRQKDGKFPIDLKSIKTPLQYAALLKKSNYYSAPLNQYANLLISFFEKLPNNLSNGTYLILFIIISTVIILSIKN